VPGTAEPCHANALTREKWIVPSLAAATTVVLVCIITGTSVHAMSGATFSDVIHRVGTSATHFDVQQVQMSGERSGVYSGIRPGMQTGIRPGYQPGYAGTGAIPGGYGWGPDSAIASGAARGVLPGSSPRGVPGKPDPARMTPQQEKNMPKDCDPGHTV
jgi:hypothetical protein